MDPPAGGAYIYIRLSLSLSWIVWKEKKKGEIHSTSMEDFLPNKMKNFFPSFFGHTFENAKGKMIENPQLFLFHDNKSRKDSFPKWP